MQKRVLCYARGVPGDWEAFCVDFDIAVQGETFEQVAALLNEAVLSYADDACHEDQATTRRLLHRRAPLFWRLRLAGSFLLHTVLGARDRKYQAGFDLPCPA